MRAARGTDRHRDRVRRAAERLRRQLRVRGAATVAAAAQRSLNETWRLPGLNVTEEVLDDPAFTRRTVGYEVSPPTGRVDIAAVQRLTPGPRAVVRIAE